MNPFLIKIQACSLQRQSAQWVSANELNKAMSIATLEQDARLKISQSIKKARKQKDAAHQRAQEIIEQAQIQANTLRSQWQQEAKREAVIQAIKWHYDEAQLTRAVMDKLQLSIANKIKTVLTDWTLDQELSPFLIKRLTAQVSDRVGQGAVILMVSSEDYQAMNLAFEGHLKVEISSTLCSGQAELSSTSLTASIDLTEHLNLLLETFVGEALLQNRGA